MPATTPEARAEALAATQHGMISRDQALRLGMAPRTIIRRVETGRWIEVYPSVYRPVSVPPSWESGLMAALLWAGPGAFASHRAAAVLWGIGDLEDPPLEISVRTGRTGAGLLSHRLQPGDRPRLRRVRSFPVTSPERSILDTCAVLPRERCGTVLDDAIRLRLTTIPRLRRMLKRVGGPGRRGSATLRYLLALRGDPAAESELERRFLRLLRRAGLPKPRVQYTVRSGGRFVARLDFAYPDRWVGIETHGYRWHGGRDRWQRDILRENRLKESGWRVLVFTWDDVVSDGARVVEQTRSLLTSGGLFQGGAGYGA